MPQGRQIGTDVVQITFRTAAGRFLFIQQLAQAGLLCGTVAGVLRRLAQHFQMPEPVGILRRYGASRLFQQGGQRCPQGFCFAVQTLQARIFLLQLFFEAQTALHTVQGRMDGPRRQVFRQAQRMQAAGPGGPGRLQPQDRFLRAATAVLQYLATAFQQPGTGRGLGSGLLMSGTGLFRFPAKGKAAADSLRQAGAGGIGREQGQQVAQGLFRLLQGRGRMPGIVPGCAQCLRQCGGGGCPFEKQPCRCRGKGRRRGCGQHGLPAVLPVLYGGKEFLLLLGQSGQRLPDAPQFLPQAVVFLQELIQLAACGLLFFQTVFQFIGIRDVVVHAARQGQTGKAVLLFPQASCAFFQQLPDARRFFPAMAFRLPGMGQAACQQGKTADRCQPACPGRGRQPGPGEQLRGPLSGQQKDQAGEQEHDAHAEQRQAAACQRTLQLLGLL